MKLECKCKLCKKALEVEVDDDYAKLGDPFKLLPLATCNRCYDYVTRKAAITRGIFAKCAQLLAVRANCPANKLFDAESRIAAELEALTKSYAKVTSEYYGSTYLWDKELVSSLMDVPNRAGDVLKNYIVTYRREVATPELVGLGSCPRD